MNRFDEIEQTKETYRDNLPEPDPTWPSQVQRALAFIIAHLFDPKLTVGWMKTQCQINNKSFAAQFEVCTGHKPKAFILHHRIQAGKECLKKNLTTVSFIALSVGYTSLSAFDKAFKNRVGVRPSIYKKQAGNGQ